MWLPLLSNEITVVVAPKPEAKVKACFPPSRAARHSSKVFLVGFPDLPYSKPVCSAGAGCLNVVAVTIGGKTSAEFHFPGPVQHELQ
ncbi:unnamed protein product [Parnassius apollo]|uniref:(apollo) hypothetical protein n=1 Tax=Parnassius apollo TaxID=110799 RepID=A0A8S3XH99_PARAO|nr:unnamed protein product [Parnassius apollo]